MNNNCKEQLFKKNLIYYYDMSNNKYTIPVPTRKWTNNQLVFTCPWCFSKYKKNSNIPYKNSYNISHYHGDGGGQDADRNYGNRQPHCQTQAKEYWGLDKIKYEFKLVGNNMIY